MSAMCFKLDPFIEAKVRLWYRLHNKKRNGFIGTKDLREISDTFETQYSLGEKTSKEIRGWLVDGWSILLQSATSAENGAQPVMSAEKHPCTLLVTEKMANNEVITEDMYVSAITEIFGSNKLVFTTCFKQMVGLFFDVFDADADGLITPEDLVKGLGCFGIANAAAVRSVHEDLDVKKLGKIDKETYVDAWIEFMMGMDKKAAMAKHFTPDIL